MKKYSCPYSLTAAYLNMHMSAWNVVDFAWLQLQYTIRDIPSVFNEEDWSEYNNLNQCESDLPSTCF